MKKVLILLPELLKLKTKRVLNKKEYYVIENSFLNSNSKLITFSNDYDILITTKEMSQNTQSLKTILKKPGKVVLYIYMTI